MIQKKYSSINSFNNSSIVYGRKESLFLISWIYIFIIGSIVLISISLFYKFNIFNMYYAKVIKNCTGSYSWGSTSTATVSSCSSNNISCGSSTVGQTYRACSRNYGCGSGTSAIGSKCIKIN